MLHVVIPVHNRREHTLACLAALTRQTYTQFRVVVVDDGSTDGTAKAIRTHFPEVILLNGNGKLFWTAAVNLGIAYALRQEAAAVLTLNNDTVPTETFLERLHEAHVQYPHALLGPLETDLRTGTAAYGGEEIDWVWATARPLLKRLPPEKQRGLHPVSWLPGRGLWIPRRVLQRVGLFDSRQFPHYFADLDFTHQARSLGFPLYLHYDARLGVHTEESGDRQNKVHKSLRNFRNHLFGIKGGGNLRDFTRFALKHCPRRYLPTYLLLGYARRVVGYWIH